MQIKTAALNPHNTSFFFQKLKKEIASFITIQPFLTQILSPIGYSEGKTLHHPLDNNKIYNIHDNVKSEFNPQKPVYEPNKEYKKRKKGGNVIRFCFQ